MTVVANVVLALVGGALLALPCHGERLPSCRLADSHSASVEAAARIAASAFSTIGTPLPFDEISVNPRSPVRTGTLSIFVIKDGAEGRTRPGGCLKGPMTLGDSPDKLSVRGGCVAVAGARPEIRCSADAIRLLDEVNGRQTRPNPTLLYVLAHELAHVAQRASGTYAGQLESVNLAAPTEQKLESLRRSCDPVTQRIEEEADAIAVSILGRRVTLPPYREIAFSERGSVYWAVDQLNLSAHAWQRAMMARGDGANLHAAFKPESLPAAQDEIERNAQRFVCDALTKRTGTLQMPARSRTHPALEQRIQRVAEALKPIADRLPDESSRTFPEVSALQGQVSPILSFMYRETGVYLDAVQREICMRVNAPEPRANCATRD